MMCVSTGTNSCMWLWEDEDMEDVPPEFAEILEENFWDLIA